MLGGDGWLLTWSIEVIDTDNRCSSVLNRR